MPSPALVFAFILATLYGVVFHVVLGGDARRLALFLLSSWVGFAVGQVMGLLFDVTLFQLGSLRVLPATLGAFFALFSVRGLTTGQVRRPARRRRA
ncbi:MAG: hypothetical protein MUC99_11060 [Anaerolineae bacterium]|jgi:hypothetical protein|nr:hypothetical protein [Anaerolineae bacterium]